MDAHVGTIASAALGAAVMYVVLRRSAKPTLPHGITVYYHSACKAFTGRADAIVRMLEQAGCEYSVKAPSDAPASYTSDEACFAVPIVAFPNGIVMSQSIAIAQQLGKALGLYPATVAGEARAIQVALNVGDLLSEGGKKLKEDKPRLTKWLSVFEGTLRASGSGFMVGPSLTFADFACYSILKLMLTLTREPGAYPLTVQFVRTMDDLPAMRAFNATGVPLLPASMMP